MRDSSSLATRPRWYQGVVKKVGHSSDPLRELSCGAELENYEIEGLDSGPLFLLGEKRQVRLHALCLAIPARR